jgi:hypothetical protein
MYIWSQKYIVIGLSTISQARPGPILKSCSIEKKGELRNTESELPARSFSCYIDVGLYTSPELPLAVLRSEHDDVRTTLIQRWVK